MRAKVIIFKFATVMRININTPQIAVLREEIEVKFGCPIRTPRHFTALSYDIEESQKEYLSETTLQRVWLYKPGYDTVAVHTLNVLSRYCGYANWDVFQQYLKDSNHVESELFDGDKLTVANLEPGTRIRIGWRPDRICVIRYLGDSRFETLESVNSKLAAGDTFSCTQMQLGRELRLDNLMRDGKEMSYIAGSRNGLTLLEIVADGCQNATPMR